MAAVGDDLRAVFISFFFRLVSRRAVDEVGKRLVCACADTAAVAEGEKYPWLLRLSRDSLIDQRIDGSLLVQGGHGCMDGALEGVGVSEGLMGEMVRLEIVPDNLDVVEFGCVFWQPLDGEPVFARLNGFKSELADMDRPVVLDQHDRFYCPSRLGTVQEVELLEVSDEVAAALGRARMHDQLARDRSSEPIIATFWACPGAGTRRSAPRKAHARAR